MLDEFFTCDLSCSASSRPTQACGPLVDRFTERDGREQFLLYLKPIINGTGNYYIEAQTRNQTRTDIIVDYSGQPIPVAASA